MILWSLTLFTRVVWTNSLSSPCIFPMSPMRDSLFGVAESIRFESDRTIERRGATEWAKKMMLCDLRDLALENHTPRFKNECSPPWETAAFLGASMKVKGENGQPKKIKENKKEKEKKTPPSSRICNVAE